VQAVKQFRFACRVGVCVTPRHNVRKAASVCNRARRNRPEIGEIPAASGRGIKQWAQDAKIELLKDNYARSSSPKEQKKLAADIQKEAYDQVIYVPLGQFLIPSAWRKSLTSVLDGPATPIFWNIDKSE
jgi:hypothetical protein